MPVPTGSLSRAVQSQEVGQTSGSGRKLCFLRIHHFILSLFKIVIIIIYMSIEYLGCFWYIYVGIILLDIFV